MTDKERKILEKAGLLYPAPDCVEAEPTYEQVMEYCHKRCLTVVTDELFNEMKARWSNEPVVRCKDCKYGQRLMDANGLHYMVCSNHFGHGIMVEKHNFCSWGERREDGKVD